ncbi:MAG: arginine repressor [Eubacteriaceae bacterium]|nr:arginine repressor [Eubacteriaceae bacterium]
MKIDRHAKIIELISSHAVETQEELTELLCAEGFNVTQATVSRDIRELKLIKALGDTGTYTYAVYESDGSLLDARIVDVFKSAVLSIDYATHFVCVNTITGMASAAAVAIDSLKNPDIIGSVAGDDTVFVMLRNNEQAERLVLAFKNMLKKADKT